MAEAKRYLFTGGGTGGHVTPNLAIIQGIRDEEPAAEILYLGIASGAEARLVPGREIPFATIRAHPFVSPRRPLAFLRFLTTIIFGIVRSVVHIVRFKPDVVVATGGYVSVPPVLAAALLRRPVFLHESNVRPGKANRLLAQFADRIGVSFEETVENFPADKTILTGYPVRSRIGRQDVRAARERLGIPADHRVAFVLGGSMGARSINRATADSIDRLLEDEKVTVIHSTGLSESTDYDAFDDTCRRLDGRDDAEPKRYILRRYFDDIEHAYAASDLVVARAGAGTIMELATVAKPVLLVPKSDSQDTHQLQNALSLKRRGRADVLFEELYDDENLGSITRVRGDLLAGKVGGLLDDEERLQQMAAALGTLVVPEAARINADVVRRMAHGRELPVPREPVTIGRLTNSEGQTTDLVFRAQTIGTERTADVRLLPGDAAGSATIRRRPTSTGDAVFHVEPKRGEVRVDGDQLEGPRELESGSTLHVAGRRLRFDTEKVDVPRPPRRGGFLARVLTVGSGTALSRVFGLLREGRPGGDVRGESYHGRIRGESDRGQLPASGVRRGTPSTALFCRRSSAWSEAARRRRPDVSSAPFSRRV